MQVWSPNVLAKFLLLKYLFVDSFLDRFVVPEGATVGYSELSIWLTLLISWLNFLSTWLKKKSARYG